MTVVGSLPPESPNPMYMYILGIYSHAMAHRYPYIRTVNLPTSTSPPNIQWSAITHRFHSQNGSCRGTIALLFQGLAVLVPWLCSRHRCRPKLDLDLDSGLRGDSYYVPSKVLCILRWYQLLVAASDPKCN